jgi:hypothetical protein
MVELAGPKRSAFTLFEPSLQDRVTSDTGVPHTGFERLRPGKPAVEPETLRMPTRVAPAQFDIGGIGRRHVIRVGEAREHVQVSIDQLFPLFT